MAARHNKHVIRFYENQRRLYTQVLTSGVTDGGQGGEPPSSKRGPHLAYILMFSMLLVFS